LAKNKKKILLLLGGPSKERAVSINSGIACYKALIKSGYNVIKYDPRKNIKKNIKKINPDIIFNCLHGEFGEDGQIQKIIEDLRIPYTHSGVKSSKIAMNKLQSKKIFIKNKILTPKYKVIKKLSDLKNRISLNKFIIKPCNEGSSVGVKIFKNLHKNNIKNISQSLKKYKTLIQEEFVGSREIQTAVIGKKAIGSVEIKPKRSFYDYKAKYSSSAKTKHLIPPKIKKKLHDQIKKIALKAHKILKCRGVTRSDFRVANDGKIYLLEINTQPGMTKLSLVPEIANYHGFNFKKLVKWILDDASTKR